MPWGQEVDSLAVVSAIVYARNRLSKWFNAMTPEELVEAEQIYQSTYEKMNDPAALGMSVYVRFLIQQREKEAAIQ